MKTTHAKTTRTELGTRDREDARALHAPVVQMAKRGMPDEDTLYDLAEFLKVFGDLTRVKIICALLNTAMCVNDLEALLDMSQSAVSHQLRVLKQAGLVRFRREGKLAYYFLADEHIRKILGQALTHVAEKQAGRPAKDSRT